VKKVYRRVPHVLERNAGPDVLAMLPSDDEVNVISGPAAVAWDLLSEDVTLDELIEEIAALYDRLARDVAPSIEGCMRDLTARGLVEERHA